MRKKKAQEDSDEIEIDEDGNEIDRDENNIYVNPEDVSANIRTKMSREERLELVKVNFIYFPIHSFFHYLLNLESTR